jgi:hypothetical protein
MAVPAGMTSASIKSASDIGALAEAVRRSMSETKSGHLLMAGYNDHPNGCRTDMLQR